MWRFENKKFGGAISSAILKIMAYFLKKISKLNLSTSKTLKNGGETAAPVEKPPFSAENWHFQAILDAFLIMIDFLCKFLELNVPTRKTEKKQRWCGRKPPSDKNIRYNPLPNFFCIKN